MLNNSNVSQEDLRKLSKFVNKLRFERFKKNATEYRGVDRTFKDWEIKAFFDIVEDFRKLSIYYLNKQST